MKFTLPFACLLFLTTLAQAQPQFSIVTKTSFTIGETVQFKSTVLNENRTLNVYLPAGYQDSLRKQYPVIYLLDGSADEDFIHIAGLVQFGNFPWVNLLPESIVVGIANTDRRRDMTWPTRNAKDKADNPSSGGSDKFIRFIETELQPFIRSHYAVNDTATLIGQSLGGLLATEILFKKPDLFTHYVIVSPSLWWDDESLLAVAPRPATTVQTVYVTAGAEEPPVMVRDAKALAKILRRTSSGRMRVIFRIAKGQDHGNILHLSVYDAFLEIFKKPARR